MSCTYRRSLILWLTGAFALSFMMAAPVAATTGWLDPTFSGDGWVRLPPPTERALEGLVVVSGSSGRSMTFVQTNAESASFDQVLAVESNGALSETFNGGAWRQFAVVHDLQRPVGFSATAGGGVVAVLGPDVDNALHLAELDSTGATVRITRADLYPIYLSANVVRLPGGSLRTCSFTSDFGPNARSIDRLDLHIRPGPGGRTRRPA